MHGVVGRTFPLYLVYKQTPILYIIHGVVGRTFPGISPYTWYILHGVVGRTFPLKLVYSKWHRQQDFPLISGIKYMASSAGLSPYTWYVIHGIVGRTFP